MELDQAWKEYSDEPALQSTGWESHMGNLGGSMDDVGVPQMDMTSPSSANSVPESAPLMPIMMQQCGEEDSLSKTPSPFNSPVTAAPASPAKGTKQQQPVPATIVDGDVSSATPSTQVTRQLLGALRFLLLLPCISILLVHASLRVRWVRLWV